MPAALPPGAGAAAAPRPCRSRHSQRWGRAPGRPHTPPVPPENGQHRYTPCPLVPTALWSLEQDRPGQGTAFHRLAVAAALKVEVAALAHILAVAAVLLAEQGSLV